MEHQQTAALLTTEQHQRYAEARQKAGMDYITDYDRWLEAHRTLAELNEAINTTWEDSEYNPENYKDFAELDEESQRQRKLEGEQAFLQASATLEQQIEALEIQLAKPDDFEKVTEDLSYHKPPHS